MFTTKFPTHTHVNIFPKADYDSNAFINCLLSRWKLKNKLAVKVLNECESFSINFVKFSVETINSHTYTHTHTQHGLRILFIQLLICNVKPNKSTI